MGLIPAPWLYAALVSAWLVSVAGAGWRGYSIGVAAVERRYAAQAADADREARRFEQQRVQRAQEAQDALYADKRRAEAYAAAAGHELDRLRHALAQRREPTSDTSAACRTDAARERELFAACAAALADLGRDADRISAKLTALQSWVRGVCVTQAIH
jgi:hypothetical protein